MKRMVHALVMLALLCALCACGGKEPVEPQTGTEGEKEAAAVRYEYRLRVEPIKKAAASDGTVLLRGEYEFPYLSVCATGEDGSERECGASEIGAQMRGVCERFNAEMEAYRAKSFAYFDDTADWAREVYTDFLAGEARWSDAYEDTIRLSESCRTEGGLLSLLLEEWSYSGGSHPNSGSRAWCFDLNEGEFVDYAALSDNPKGLCDAAAKAILTQIYDEGMDEGLFEDFSDTLCELERAEVYFDAAGMTVIYPVYSIAPYAMGSPTFTVPYARILRCLNERGAALLPIDESDGILADFFEAQELWNYFDMGTMPLSHEHSYDEDGRVYYRVDCEGFSTMAELRERLTQRFDDAIAAQLLASGTYREFEGALYGVDAARGSNLYRGAAEYTVQRSGEGGEVIASVEEYGELEWNEDAQCYEQEVLGYTRIEFPFVLSPSGARFTSFESIW